MAVYRSYFKDKAEKPKQTKEEIERLGRVTNLNEESDSESKPLSNKTTAHIASPDVVIDEDNQ